MPVHDDRTLFEFLVLEGAQAGLSWETILKKRGNPHFTFRFAADRLIARFHLEGVEAGRQLAVYKFDPDSGERRGLLAKATQGEGGWVDLPEPIIVRASEAFVAEPDPSAR